MADDKNAKQKKPSATAAETKYDVAEFVEVAETVFDTMPECVMAAFRCKGITQATKSEAMKIVSEFLKKEVTR